MLQHIRLTVPQYVHLTPEEKATVGGHYGTADTWDALRSQPGPYGLSADREEWSAAARARSDLIPRADAIAEFARAQGVHSISSYGVGAAMLERLIVDRLPDVSFTCSDQTPLAMERLAEVFPESRVLLHDLRSDPPVSADLHLLHRVDADLSNDDWRMIFPRFREPVLFVISEVLTLQGLRTDLRRLATRRATRNGWLRSEATWRSLWAPLKATPVQAADLEAYLLTPA